MKKKKKSVRVAGRTFSKSWKLPKSSLGGRHGSLTTLEYTVSTFALLLTKYRLEQLSFLNSRDHAEAAYGSCQGRASSNTRTRSYFHGASARSIYTVSDASALLTI